MYTLSGEGAPKTVQAHHEDGIFACVGYSRFPPAYAGWGDDVDGVILGEGFRGAVIAFTETRNELTVSVILDSSLCHAMFIGVGKNG